MMVFILEKELSFYNHPISTKNLMTNYISDNLEEYDNCSSNQSIDNNELVHRKSRKIKEPCDTNFDSTTQMLLNQQAKKNEKKNIINGHTKMNENTSFPNSSTVTYQAHQTLSATNEQDSDDCYKLQADFRRRGWNVAGANILAVSCWIAKSQFLYARPRLTAFDFIIAAIITTACGILARYSFFTLLLE